MKIRRKVSLYLLVTYNICKIAYQIGFSLLKHLHLLFGLTNKSINLILNLILNTIKKISFVINILIVYIYRLRYGFGVIFAIYLGYCASVYYRSIPNPVSIGDFRPPGNIIILDRHSLPLFNSQEINQQLINAEFSLNLNSDQLSRLLVGYLKTAPFDFWQKKIVALRIKKNFSPKTLNNLYIYLSNYSVFNFQRLNIHKRSPGVVTVVLNDLKNQYAKDLAIKNLVITTSIDQTFQNSLQVTAVNTNQLNNLIIVYDQNTQEIIAVINQHQDTAPVVLKKMLRQNKLTLTLTQKQSIPNFAYLMEKENSLLLKQIDTQIKNHYLISFFQRKGGETINYGE